jgi:hypothetical protein
MMRKTFLLAAAMFAGSLFASTAQAQIQISHYDWNPTVVNVDQVWYNGVNILDNVGAGRFEMTGTENGNPVDLFTYCIDLFEPIHKGVFTREPVSLVLPNAVKQGQLLALLEHSETLLATEPNVTNQRLIAAATQLAVWEIVYEAGTGPGAYDANSGTVYTVNPKPFATSARSLANTYLADITSLAWVANAAKSLVLLYAPRNQNQVMLVPSGVPEPSTWMTMIAGAGMIGGVLRRKRRAEAKTAA